MDQLSNEPIISNPAEITGGNTSTIPPAASTSSVPVSTKPKTVISTTGRRKNAVARVRIIFPGTGKRIVNSRPAEQYFGGHLRQQHTFLQPLQLITTADSLDLYVNVTGGGVTGQAEAIRHGISRGLVKFDGTLKKVLRQRGFLTRDPRMVERKKPGQPKARKKFQWTKR